MTQRYKWDNLSNQFWIAIALTQQLISEFFILFSNISYNNLSLLTRRGEVPHLLSNISCKLTNNIRSNQKTSRNEDKLNIEF